MADEKKDAKKEPTRAERCKAILQKLELHRLTLEDAYIVSLDHLGVGVTRDSIELLDTIQELDEHIAEMKKHHK